MDKKYLFVFEDGSFSVGTEIPLDVFNGYEDGVFEIINMATGQIYVGNDTWEDIESI